MLRDQNKGTKVVFPRTRFDGRISWVAVAFVLTNDGATDWSAYPTREGKDSHPSAAGNTKSAAAIVAFLMDVLPTGGILESP